MEPTIHIKELIIIRESENYEINDIVTYRDKENNFVTHRIIEKNGNLVITRGDNNTINDEAINIKNIEGKVIYHSIVLGELFLYWLKPILCVICFVSLLNCVRYSLISRKVKVSDEESS